MVYKVTNELSGHPYVAHLKLVSVARQVYKSSMYTNFVSQHFWMRIYVKNVSNSRIVTLLVFGNYTVLTMIWP